MLSVLLTAEMKEFTIRCSYFLPVLIFKNDNSNKCAVIKEPMILIRAFQKKLPALRIHFFMTDIISQNITITAEPGRQPFFS